MSQNPLVRLVRAARSMTVGRSAALTREQADFMVGLVGPEPKRITFVLDLFNGTHDRDLSNQVLRLLLNALFLTDVLYLQAHPETPRLYESGVVYQEEPPGAEDWVDVPTVLRMGFGDCEDLACWRAAEAVVRDGCGDARPDFSCEEKDGLYLYHIFVRYADGSVEDPSRVLGMR